MNQRDVTIDFNEVKPRTEYTCLRTGHRCALVPVVLRRMVILPVLWLGWKVATRELADRARAVLGIREPPG